jgi:excinuclease ABC subunit C
MIFTQLTRNNIPQIPGVYIYKNGEGKILYVGKAKNLKNRIDSYFRKSTDTHSITDKTAQLVSQIEKIEIIIVESEFEALILEQKLIKKFLPKYNVIWKDDKRYLYVKFTNEEFPTIILSRNSLEKDGIYYGPFPSAGTIRNILKIIRKIYPYCGQKRNIRKPCFYTHIGLCNPCPGFIITQKKEVYLNLKRSYNNNIRNIKSIFEGKFGKIKKELENEMNAYSENQQFEQAVIVRDRIKNLNYLLKGYNGTDAYLENPEFLNDERKTETKELKTLLQANGMGVERLSSIECFDISNICGKHAVGGMVKFIDGLPDNKSYRRFKINLIDTPNDFLMLREMIARRLRHNEWNYPDIMLVDGGKPQLLAILMLFSQMKISIPLIGLAKENEEIIIPYNYGFTAIKLDRNSKPLHLLQRLRDEAHRFAHEYHLKIRSKQMYNLFESRQ